MANIINGVCYQHYEKSLVLRNKKVVQMLMFALQKKFGRGTIIKSVFDYRFNSNKHTHVSVRNTSFLGFYCTNIVFLVGNLGLFEITEWEPCVCLLNTDILAGNPAIQ